MENKEVVDKRLLLQSEIKLCEDGSIEINLSTTSNLEILVGKDEHEKIQKKAVSLLEGPLKEIQDYIIEASFQLFLKDMLIKSTENAGGTKSPNSNGVIAVVCVPKSKGEDKDE